MPYAEVAVNSPLASRGSFSYSLPAGMELETGQAVWVPFGPRLLQGIVVELTAAPQVPQTRDIAALVVPPLRLNPTQIALARWLNQHYLSPLFEAVRPFLPPGFERQPRAVIQAISPAPTPPPPELEPDLAILQQKKKWRLEAAQAALGKERSALDKLLKLGLATKSLELEPIRVRPKTIAYLRLAVSPEEAEAASLKLLRRSPKRAELLRFLLGQAEPISISEIRQRTGCSLAHIKSLEGKGLIQRVEVPQTRDPLAGRYYPPQPLSVLNPDQQRAAQAIASALSAVRTPRPLVGEENPSPRPVRLVRSADSRNGADSDTSFGELDEGPSSQVFLLHGVTGSGKTEVYLHALAQARERGKRGIVLVPEIALTPQTIQRFASRFPGRVAVLHSRLTLGEQFDEWHRISRGDFDVVIGSRSAVFAPQPDLGLIIMDEEHEPSYKQDEGPLRYHAREVAIRRAALEGAVVVLGSATPDIETYYAAQEGSDISELSLPQRFSPSGVRSLPPVEIVDMRTELRAGNRSIFSRALSQALARTLRKAEQAILFLNRRGTATFIQCRDCGFALRCPRCDLALTYHQVEGRRPVPLVPLVRSADSRNGADSVSSFGRRPSAPGRGEPVEGRLLCHQCGYRRRLPETCPRCHSPRIKFLGLGTQALEAEVKAAFPTARTLRWDRDVTRGQQSHEAILGRFLAREADILIGTQMIAKGLDMPAVTLVGVVLADTGLHFPDFRAAERTFQLISQVAGRAGRGPEAGRVIVQTYSPEHYAVIAAAEQDYLAFYQKEIAYRLQYGNPPFSRLVRLLYSHTSAARCQQETERLAAQLREEKTARGLGSIDIIGPSPAFLERLRGRYRWQIILRGPEPTRLLADLTWPRGWSLDVDPMSLL